MKKQCCFFLKRKKHYQQSVDGGSSRPGRISRMGVWLFYLPVSLFLSLSLFSVFPYLALCLCLSLSNHFLTNQKNLNRSLKSNNWEKFLLARQLSLTHPIWMNFRNVEVNEGKSWGFFVPYRRSLSLLLFPASQFIFVTLNPSKLPVKPQKCLRKSFSSWKRAFFAYFGTTLMPRTSQCVMWTGWSCTLKYFNNQG